MRRPVAIYLGLCAVNVLAWAWAWTAFAGQPVLLGMALLAYTLGLRHAFDADHIAAIDNVVRRLMSAGQRADTTGLYFSLGHSTVVVLASAAVGAAASALTDSLDRMREVGTLVGAAVSASFLLLIGLANLVVLRGIVRTFRRAQRVGGQAPAAVEADWAIGGPLARLFRPLVAAVSSAAFMFPVGFLFGLGFDTASEVGLIGLSATQAGHGASFATILIFPALFTSGMSLMDTADSMLMVRVYGRGCVDPVRRLRYNLVLTAASVVVSLLIGTVEGLDLVGRLYAFDGAFWALVRGANDSVGWLGFATAAFFLAVWAASVTSQQITAAGGTDGTASL